MNQPVCQGCGAVGEHIAACKRECIAPTGCWWPKCACEPCDTPAAPAKLAAEFIRACEGPRAQGVKEDGRG